VAICSGDRRLSFLWAAFWIVVALRKESVSEIITKPEFFQVITVMGVVAATVVLSLAGRIEGQLTAAILSGIAGYSWGPSPARKRSPNQPMKPTTAGRSHNAVIRVYDAAIATL